MADVPRPRFEELAAAFVYLQQSPHTRSAYRTDLDGFAAWCSGVRTSPLEAAPADIDRYRDDCTGAGASNATVARRLSALSSFFAFAVERGAVEASPLSSTDRPAPASGATPLLAAADVDAFLAATAFMGPKTVTLVNLLLYDGLKLSEVLDADVDDLLRSPADGRILALTTQRRRGPTTTALDPRSCQAVTVYLAGRTDGALLVGDSPSRATARLTRFGADYLLKQASERAGLGRTVSANVLRRTHVAAAHERGESAEDIQERLGHADVRSTRRHLPPTTADDR